MDGIGLFETSDHLSRFLLFGKVLKLGMDNPSIREASILSKQLWYFELGVLDSNDTFGCFGLFIRLR